MIIRKIINKVQKKVWDPIRYSRKIGVTIGENCVLNGLPNWGSEPWLITMGEHTEISFDCVFITHDGGTWVFREQEKYKQVINFGRIDIGNNCFIGARSIILPGVSIGDNSVVAAGTVVTKDIPPGEVWGGVPAKFIQTTDEYAEKCLAKNPIYDMDNFKKNKKDELLKIL